MSTLAVIAKAPVAGRSKTRLCPPLTPAQAADVAAAALGDTLDAVRATPASRRVLVLEGEAPRALISGIEVIAQRGAGLDERLANAFTDLDAPTLIIGMDTPQVTPELLTHGLRLLAREPAVLGPASDGGYWAIGLRAPDPRALRGVPMSTAHTLDAQRRRLRDLGLACAELPELRDVDTFADAELVASLAPASRFAGTLERIGFQPVEAA